jgi:hypothetical protein
MRIAMRLKALNAPAQIRKRARACGTHAPLLQDLAFTASSLSEPAAGSFVHDMF